MYSLVSSGTPGKGGTFQIRRVRRRRSVIAAQKLRNKGLESESVGMVEQGKKSYSQRRQIAGGSLEGPSPKQLKPAIATEEARVFRWRKKKVGSAVANGGLLPMTSQRVVIFMG